MNIIKGIAQGFSSYQKIDGEQKEKEKKESIGSRLLKQSMDNEPKSLQGTRAKNETFEGGLNQFAKFLKSKKLEEDEGL